MGDAGTGLAASADATIREVYGRLYAAYGPQGWWPGGGVFEVIVGAILTQSAAWTNVEKALANLKTAGVLSPEGIAQTREGELAALLRPSGYFNAKARKLKAFVALLEERFGGDLGRLLATPVGELRPLLLATHGIGPETSDSILLYAAERPVFVIDAYTRRVFSRLGIAAEPDTYEGWQRLFSEALPPDAAMFNEYHALTVRLAKDHCRREPVCKGCPLLDGCPTGLAGQAASTRRRNRRTASR
jgi:endonuclease-3 related protein